MRTIILSSVATFYKQLRFTILHVTLYFMFDHPRGTSNQCECPEYMIITFMIICLTSTCHVSLSSYNKPYVVCKTDRKPVNTRTMAWFCEFFSHKLTFVRYLSFCFDCRWFVRKFVPAVANVMQSVHNVKWFKFAIVNIVCHIKTAISNCTRYEIALLICVWKR